VVSLNLSRSTGDSVEAVTENNQRLLATVGLKPEQTVSAWLNHGDHVAVVGKQHQGAALHETDAMISATPGLALSMRFAIASRCCFTLPRAA